MVANKILCYHSKPSLEAVKNLPKKPIDILNIDGNFSDEGSLQDVHTYFPLVKKGGYIILSNVNGYCNGKPSKVNSFIYLFNNCEVIGSVDRDNTILFKKF